MAVGWNWKPLLPILTLSALLLYEEWASIPSCALVPPDPTAQAHNPDDLKVMMVADLLLLGSDAGYFHLLFRDHYTSKFFEKSYGALKPDLLVVLGDVSARVYYGSVVRELYNLLGPFLDAPLHVVLGDRDVGACRGGMSSESVGRVARRFPGLDAAGCGAFEIGNVSFVSLNAVALLCGSSKVRFGVEKAVERESEDFRSENERVMGENGRVVENRKRVYGFGWRENAMASGTGPVVLLHFPLSQIGSSPSPARYTNRVDGRGTAGAGLYDLMHKLPPNATEYIFQALKPRIVFSAQSGIQ